MTDLVVTDHFRVGVVDPARTTELRRTVLRPNLPPGAPLPGDDLPDAVHIAAFTSDGSPPPDGTRPLLSTCFIYPDPCPSLPAARQPWHLRQMATDPGARGTGAGSAVIAGVLAYLSRHAEGMADLLWCNARVSAKGFYLYTGFQPIGPEFTDSEHPIPHVRMWRPIGPLVTDH